ncbi:MAG: SEC-C metal-binding domain-containing protein [Acidobacteriota bacterium]
MIKKIPGRNDPCYCGSGKKYKKCCLAKDENARQARKSEFEGEAADSESALEDPVHDRESDPHIAAFNALLEDFEAAGYESKVDIFNRTLDNPELMDGEMAFEMLQNLHRLTIEYGERNRFDMLVENLRRCLPETYAAEAPYFLKWRIINALVEARFEDVSFLFQELARLAGKDIDLFNRAEEMVAYHGQLPVLVDSMRLAWPEVQSSNDIVGWGVDEFRIRVMSYEILNFAERTLGSTDPNTELLERLRLYSETDAEEIAVNLAHITGRKNRQWAMSDFTLSQPRSDMDEDDAQDVIDEDAGHPDSELNLYHLTVEFLGWLHRDEGVPYAKGELGRRELHRFIMERHYGRLEYRESMMQSFQRDIDRKRGGKTMPMRKYRRYEHVLVPDPERLDHYLSDLLGMMNQLHHRASALFELIPGWLRFLEIKRLIDDATRIRTISLLAPLADSLGRIFARYAEDPGPGRALDGWRDKNLSY